MEFGDRLRLLRERAKMSQEELGRGLGARKKGDPESDAGKQVVLGWEKNRHFPKADQLAQICKKLNCSADHLLFGTEAVRWPFQDIDYEKVIHMDEHALGRLEGAMISTMLALGQDISRESGKFADSQPGANQLRETA